VLHQFLLWYISCSCGLSNVYAAHKLLLLYINTLIDCVVYNLHLLSRSISCSCSKIALMIRPIAENKLVRVQVSNAVAMYVQYIYKLLLQLFNYPSCIILPSGISIALAVCM
jgi:hypothetical protein